MSERISVEKYKKLTYDTFKRIALQQHSHSNAIQYLK